MTSCCQGNSHVELANSITSIPDNQFSSCGSLISVTIPDSVTSIGVSAFEVCGSLISVTIPDSVTSISNYAFSYTGLTYISFPSNITSIGDYAFESCYNLTSIVISTSVTTIGISSFKSCSLLSLTIPDSVTTIGDFAFYSNNNLPCVSWSGRTGKLIGNNVFPSTTSESCSSSYPTSQPSSQPSRQPSSLPSSQPSNRPSQPSSQPSVQPTNKPSGKPSCQPSRQPSTQPSSQPSMQPTQQPTSPPSSQPTNKPSSQPSSKPSKPSSQPSSLPSSQPSSQPTSQPSCGFGSVDCSLCLPGTFTDEHDLIHCKLCPINSFNSMYGSIFCTPCKYPYLAINSGSTRCFNISIGFDFYMTLSIVILLASLFIYFTSQAKERKYEAFLLMIFPTLDVLSDLLYICTTTFISDIILSLSLVSFILPNILFLAILRRANALIPSNLLLYPGFIYVSRNLIWLGVSNGYPLFDGEKLSLSFDSHDSIPKITSYIVIWIVLILCQLVYLLIYLLVWPIISFILILLWSIVGLYLFQSKCICIGPVWNYWFKQWIGDEKMKLLNLNKPDDHIDFAILNESLLAEFLFETLPQLLIQSYNTILIEAVDGAYIFSVILSGYNTLNGLYKYGYHVLYKRIPVSDVPREIELLGGFLKYKNNKQIVPDAENQPEIEAWSLLVEIGNHQELVDLVETKNLKSPFDLRCADDSILEEILCLYLKLKTDREHQQLKELFDKFKNDEKSYTDAAMEVVELFGFIRESAEQTLIT